MATRKLKVPTIENLLDAEREAASDEFSARYNESDIWCGNPYAIAALNELDKYLFHVRHAPVRAQVLATLALAYELDQMQE